MKILEKDHHKFIFYQLLQGINYLHQRNLIHRDLKPANILVNTETIIKICDFGLIRSNKNKDLLNK
jgi:serine/threonine protein kinase